MDTGNTGPGEWGRLAPRARYQARDEVPRPRDEAEWPFCGDEYPPLKGSPGTVVCTKQRHPAAEMHLNEETGWVWQNGPEARSPREPGNDVT